MRAILLIMAVAACGGGEAATSDAGATGDAGGLPTCSGILLTANGVLDLDLDVVHVTGNVTLNGGALPSASPPASLVFTETTTNVSLTIDLHATYDIALTPGTYDIAFASSQPSPCAGPLPCNSGPIKTGVGLSSDGVLDLDIPAVTASGKITVNGAAVTATSSAQLGFTLAGGKPSYVPLAPMYTTTILPGSYVVGFATSTSSCAGPLPCNTGPVKSVAIGSSGVLDVDIPAVTVSGAITVAHAALPAQPAGKLAFTLAGGAPAKLALAPTYAATLLAGTYAVGFAAEASACTALPCNSGPIVPSVSLASSGVLDVDIPSVKVTGAVRLNGVAAPGGAQLGFALTGGTEAKVALAPSYAVTLLAGTYTANFLATQPCTGALPCNTGPIKTSVSLASNGVLDLEIHSVKVTGKITLAGAALPAAPEGNASFTIASGGAAVIPLAPTYATTLLAGTYTVGYASSGTTCEGPLPCNSGALKDGVALASDGVLDLDIPAVSITGNVTLAGAVLPATAATRGDVAFALNDGTSASTADFGTSGAASYAVTILPGHYLVVYNGNAALCDPTMLPTPPCMAEIVKGCP